MTITKASTHITQNEALAFERSQTGRRGYRLPALDVEETPVDELLPAELRRDDDLEGLPELSEPDVVRHFTRISTWNYNIDLGLYPLGSCTMKYNSRLNEKVARIPGFANLHALDVEETPVDELLPAELRRDDDLEGLPELSEPDVVRHFTRISTWNYNIDLGLYPLGSCTMKYNSRLNEKVARIPGFANLHPLAPEEDAQGALQVMYELQQHLAEITGLPGVSLQPAAGADR